MSILGRIKFKLRSKKSALKYEVEAMGKGKQGKKK